MNILVRYYILVLWVFFLGDVHKVPEWTSNEHYFKFYHNLTSIDLKKK